MLVPFDNFGKLISKCWKLTPLIYYAYALAFNLSIIPPREPIDSKKGRANVGVYQRIKINN